MKFLGNSVLRIFLLIIALCSIDSFAKAQLTTSEQNQLIDNYQSVSKEKTKADCYVQTSKDIYETGEDLWFKAYLLNSQTLEPYALDTTLYIELIRAEDNLAIWQEKYHINRGIADGNIVIKADVVPGDYWLVACSGHSFFNDGSDLQSVKKIIIKKNIIEPYKISGHFSEAVFKPGESIHFNLMLAGKAGQTLSGKRVDAELRFNEKVIQTSVNNTDFSGRADFDFNSNNVAKGAILRIKVFSADNYVENSADIPVPGTITKNVNYNLFPEGGNLVSGVQNLLAFKVTDGSGLPENTIGTLYENGTEIAKFRCLHDGMGSFSFLPKTTRTYSIKFSTESQDTTLTINDIKPEGIVLHLNKVVNNSADFTILKSISLKSQKIYLRAQMRGIVYSVGLGMLKDSLHISMNLTNCPQGVAEVTLFDETLKPIAERLLYVNSEREFHIKIALNKTQYQVRNQVTLKIHVTDELGNPLVTNLGLSVADSLYKNANDQSSILAYYYLSTQIRGKLYDAGYYFNKNNSERLAALDLLLLTQGWRRYTWEESYLKSLELKPILSDDINSSIHLPKSDNDQTFVMYFSPDNQKYNKLVSTGTGNTLHITPADLSAPKGGYLYLKAMVRGDTKVNFSVDDPFHKIYSSLLSKQIEYPYISFTQGYRNVSANDDETSGYHRLNEVDIKAKAIDGFRDKYLARLDSITKMDLTTDYVTHYNPKTKEGGILNCPGCVASPDKIKPIEGHTYQEFLNPENVKVVFGTKHVIHTGTRLVVYHYPSLTEEQLLALNKLVRIRGYIRDKEFYQPDYGDTIQADSQIPDVRNTLIWSPQLITDRNGNASVTFYCSDIATEYLGIIEGVADDGRLGNSHFSFTVKKNISTK